MTELVHSMAVLDHFLKQQDTLRSDIAIVLTKTKEAGISLDDRWTYFLKAIPLLAVESYGNGQLDVLDPSDESTLYDDFNCDKYQTKTYDDMDETIMSYIDDINIDTADEWEQKQSAKGMRWKPNYDAWREAVMASGYGGFTYDW